MIEIISKLSKTLLILYIVSGFISVITFSYNGFFQLYALVFVGFIVCIAILSLIGLIVMPIIEVWTE